MTAEKLHDALSLLPSDLITATDKVRTQPGKTVIHWRRWVSMAACAVLVLGVSFVFVNVFLPKGGSKEAALEMAADCAAEEPAAVMGESAAVTGSDAQPYSGLDTIVLTPTIGASEAEEAASGSSVNGASGDVPIAGCTSETQPPEIAVDLASTQYILTSAHQNSSVNMSANPQTVLIPSREALDAYYAQMQGLFDLASFYESCRAYDEVWFESHDLLVLRLGMDCGTMGYQVTGFEAQEYCEPPAWEITLTPEEFGTDLSADSNAYWHILLPVDKNLLTDQTIILVEMEEAS